MADWGAPRTDTALGLAYAGYGNAQTAGVAEARLNSEAGEITVERFWAAIDARRPRTASGWRSRNTHGRAGDSECLCAADRQDAGFGRTVRGTV